MAQVRIDFCKMMSHHQTMDLIQALKKDARTINESHSQQGLTPLQLAAREGMLTAVLWLLHAGADIEKTTLVQSQDRLVIQQAQKTPLYLALERGHTLLATLLLAIGASSADVIRKATDFKQPDVLERLQHLKPDPEILGCLLYWTLTHYDSTFTLPFIEKLLSRFQPRELKEEKRRVEEGKEHVIDIRDAFDFGRHLELAVHLKQAGVAERLYKAGTTSFDHIPTAGFWAAVNSDAKLHATICKQDYEVVMTLRQLQARKVDLFETYYSNASLAQQNSLFDSEPSPLPKSALTSRQHHIYQAAAFGMTSEMKLLCKQDDDYMAVVQYAFDKKNYVALKLLQTIRDQQDFLKRLLKKENRSLAFFILIGNDIDLYDFSLASRDENAVLTKLMTQDFTSAAGLFQSTISRGTKDSARGPTPAEKVLFTLIPNEASLRLDIFLRCLHDRFPDPDFTALLARQEVDLEKRMIQPLRSYVASLLQERFNRFGLILPLEKQEEKEQEKKQNSDVLSSVFGNVLVFLDIREQKGMVRVSRRFYRDQTCYQQALEKK